MSVLFTNSNSLNISNKFYYQKLTRSCASPLLISDRRYGNWKILCYQPMTPRSLTFSSSRRWSDIKHWAQHRHLTSANCGWDQKLGGTPSFDAKSLTHPECNITHSIAQRIGMNLHLKPNHPIHIIKNRIELYWKSQVQGMEAIDDMHPLVSTYSNFDSLLIDKEHSSRDKSDTYYYNKDTVLRTHTSAHQSELLSRGLSSFLVTGDVYRRDEIDSSHYPVFHQMEGVRLLRELEKLHMSTEERIKVVEMDLKKGLEGMVKVLFGNVQMRWIDAYFPFTHPSFELEIFYQNEWMEVLGCGVIRPEIIEKATGKDASLTLGWAFGLGLERLAMVLFSIPDIRLFWSDDKRFLDQYASGKMDITFVPYSKYPLCFKDISFWLPGDSSFHVNDLNEGVRDIAGDLVEKVQLMDIFVQPKTGRTSHCYRINYRSMDRNLTNEEIDVLQDRVRAFARDQLRVDLR